MVGFYITNTTYAYMSMKNGDAIGKKFGGATGNDPDWFKLTVRGYKNGSLKSDSVEFYLADFRSSNNANDYILKTWQWVDCNPLGQVDSVTFFLSSSDNSSWGMNTPAFFAMDNFTTGQGVGINEVSAYDGLNIYPNPTNGKVSVKLLSVENVNVDITVYNSIGVLMKKENVNFNTGYNTHLLNLEEMESGMYFIQLSGTDKKQIIKIIKN